MCEETISNLSESEVAEIQEMNTRDYTEAFRANLNDLNLNSELTKTVADADPDGD